MTKITERITNSESTDAVIILRSDNSLVDILAGDLISSGVSNDRRFLSELSVSPVISGHPTLQEIQFASGGTSPILDAVIFYTGTILDTDEITHAYIADRSGVITLVYEKNTTSELSENKMLLGNSNNLPTEKSNVEIKTFLEIKASEIDVDSGYTAATSNSTISGGHDMETVISILDYRSNLTSNSVISVTNDTVNNKLKITYSDNTVVSLSIDDIITDIYVSGATLNASTNILTLSNVDPNVADVTVDLSDFVNTEELVNALLGKVDKDGDKVLSEVDFTNILKTKLDSIEDEATKNSDARELLLSSTYDKSAILKDIVAGNTVEESISNLDSRLDTYLANLGDVNVQSDWLNFDENSDEYILNKPGTPIATQILLSGTYQKITIPSEIVAGNDIELAISKLDKKVEDAVAGSGEVNVQSDWDVSDTGSDAFINNKPDIPTTLSELSDDATHRLVTDTEKVEWNSHETNVQSDWDETTDTLDSYIQNKPDATGIGLSDSYIKALVSTDITHTDDVETAISKLDKKVDDAATTGGDDNVQVDWDITDDQLHSFILNKPTIPTLLSELGEDSTHRIVTDTEKVEWNSHETNIQSDWDETDDQVDSYITNKPSLISDFVEDSTHRTVTDVEKVEWNSHEINVKSDWNETTDTLDSFILNKPSIPTLLSELGEDSTHRIVTDSEKVEWNSHETNVQSDWNETTDTLDSYIQNKPDATGIELSDAYVKAAVTGNITPADDIETAISKLDKKVEDAVAGSGEVNVQPNWNETRPSLDSFIVNKPTIPTSLSELSDDNNHRLVSDSEKAIWNSHETNIQPNWNETNPSSNSFIVNKPTIPMTLAELGEDSDHNIVSDSEKDFWNSHEINIQSNWNINDNGSDAYILNKPSVPTTLSDLTEDNTHRTVTDIEIIRWNSRDINVQSDWNDSNINSDAHILNKPNATAITLSGTYAKALQGMPLTPSISIESAISNLEKLIDVYSIAKTNQTLTSTRSITLNNSEFFIVGSINNFSITSEGSVGEITLEGDLTLKPTSGSIVTGVAFYDQDRDNFSLLLSPNTLTGDRTLYVPDASGTIALTSDITSVIDSSIQKTLINDLGDLLVGTSDNNVVIKSKGTDGSFLSVDSGNLVDGLTYRSILDSDMPVLTGYTVAASESAISATDTAKSALGKLEKNLSDKDFIKATSGSGGIDTDLKFWIGTQTQYDLIVTNDQVEITTLYIIT